MLANIRPWRDVAIAAAFVHYRTGKPTVRLRRLRLQCPPVPCTMTTIQRNANTINVDLLRVCDMGERRNTIYQRHDIMRQLMGREYCPHVCEPDTERSV